MKKNILIVGNGAREDALAWMLRRSPFISHVFLSKELALDINNPPEVVKISKKLGINFVVVGSDEPLQHGIVDKLIKEKIDVYGPTKKAAKIEGSKVFATNFMKKYNIPQPFSVTFSSYALANEYLVSKNSLFKNGVVVKADGLALGKGVFVCKSVSEAKKALKAIMIDKLFGKAGKKVVIQEKLNGYEVSVTVISDGKKYLILPFTEDHKQAYDHDMGANTGGMGVAAPHPLVNDKLAFKIENSVVKPTLKYLKKENREFRGTLYPGLMIVNGQPFVLEFNARFGDPETEALLPLLPPGLDFFKLLHSASKGKLIKTGVLKTKKAAVAVALASEGYPQNYKKGIPIKGLFRKYPDNLHIFHAGTKKTDDGYETAGGRVLMLTAVSDTLGKARKNVYKFIGKKGIYFKGMHFRKDIGARKR